MSYKLYKNIRTGELEDVVIRTSDNAVIPYDDNNRDYQEYLLWKSIDGNEPDPAD